MPGLPCVLPSIKVDVEKHFGVLSFIWARLGNLLLSQCFGNTLLERPAGRNSITVLPVAPDAKSGARLPMAAFVHEAEFSAVYAMGHLPRAGHSARMGSRLCRPVVAVGCSASTDRLAVCPVARHCLVANEFGDSARALLEQEAWIGNLGPWIYNLSLFTNFRKGQGRGRVRSGPFPSSGIVTSATS